MPEYEGRIPEMDQKISKQNQVFPYSFQQQLIFEDMIVRQALPAASACRTNL
jgi:hypothetical protein